MLVWGGRGPGPVNTGGRYNPATDTWTAVSTDGAPSARSVAMAVWTGTEMLVWGGFDGTYLNTGGRYNPVTDSWTATATTDAPDGRFYHTAVWTGSEMIVWGGASDDCKQHFMCFKTGGRYNPETDSWTPSAVVKLG